MPQSPFSVPEPKINPARRPGTRVTARRRRKAREAKG